MDGDLDNKGNRPLWRKKRVLVGIVFLVGVGIAVWQISSRQNQNGIEEAVVKRGVVQEALILSGTVHADKYASLGFLTSGTLSYVNVTEGDWVARGEVLGSLDTKALNAAYQQSLNSLRAAEATVDRVHDDVKDNDDDEDFVTKEKRVVAEVAKDNAYDAVTIARNNLQNARILAPFEGIVTYVASSPGVSVIAGSTQFEVLDPETIYIEVGADQNEVNELSLGMEALLTLDSYPDKEFSGTVTYISYTPRQGEVGTVYTVKVTLDPMSTEFSVRVGMTGDVSFVLEERQNVVYIPADFLKSDSDGDYVLLNGERTPISIGLEGEDRIEVLQGLAEGDVIQD